MTLYQKTIRLVIICVNLQIKEEKKNDPHTFIQTKIINSFIPHLHNKFFNTQKKNSNLSEKFKLSKKRPYLADFKFKLRN